MKPGGFFPLLAFVCCAPFWGVSAPGSAQTSGAAPHFAVPPALLDDGMFRLEKPPSRLEGRGSATSSQPSAFSGPVQKVSSGGYSSSADLLAIDLNVDGIPSTPAHADAVGLPDAAGLPDASGLPDAPDAAPAAAGGGGRYHPERANERMVTWKTLPKDFLHDQKDIWFTFPGKLGTGHHWVPVLAVAGVTAGLIYADPHIMPYFRAHQGNIDKINDGFDPMITTAEVIAVPAGLLAAGYARHDNYQISTGLMGALAYGDSVVPNLVIKAITRRERPSDIPAPEPFTGTFFNGGKSPLKGSSFPSGHATAAFSVATVVAYRYRNHKWVPIAAYALATAIGLSRIATMAHFPSDVFLGAAMGYSVARYQTVRPQ
jgi:membrane-associated phospholipid phosphatase